MQPRGNHGNPLCPLRIPSPARVPRTRATTANLLVPLALLLAAGALLAHDAVPATPTLSTAQWRADLHYLATELPKRHVAPYWHLTRQQFQREVADLDRRLPALDPDQDWILHAPLDAHLKPKIWPSIGEVPAGSQVCDGDY